MGCGGFSDCIDSASKEDLDGRKERHVTECHSLYEIAADWLATNQSQRDKSKPGRRIKANDRGGKRPSPVGEGGGDQDWLASTLIRPGVPGHLLPAGEGSEERSCTTGQTTRGRVSQNVAD